VYFKANGLSATYQNDRQFSPIDEPGVLIIVSIVVVITLIQEELK